MTLHSNSHKVPRHLAAFSLLEMAIVLVVIGILVAGSFGVMTNFVRQDQYMRDKALIKQAKNSLVGYALSRSGLPAAGVGNTLPTAALGIRGIDVSAGSLLYDANDDLLEAATGNDITNFCDNAVDVLNGTSANQLPAVCNDTGNAGTACADTVAVAFVVYGVGPDKAANDENSDGDRIYENPAKSIAATYDDRVEIYSLAEFISDCKNI